MSDGVKIVVNNDTDRLKDGSLASADNPLECYGYVVP